MASMLKMKCDACGLVGGDEIAFDPVMKIDLCPECKAIQATHGDFTSPHYQHEPSTKGIHYDKFFTPQKCGSLLCKVAFKSQFKPNGKGGPRAKVSRIAVKGAKK